MLALIHFTKAPLYLDSKHSECVDIWGRGSILLSAGCPLLAKELSVSFKVLLFLSQRCEVPS